MEVYIVTGASKGIGAALMKQLHREGHIAHGLARTNEEKIKHIHIIDLTTNHGHEVLKEIIYTYNEAISYTLINNASIVEPIHKVGHLEAHMITKAIDLNITAVIQLVNTFIQLLQEKDCEKRIMNISSGAGRKAYEGWSVYGATKAAIDHFSTIVAKEQQKEMFPIAITSIAPGIVDTKMQEVIRSSTKDEFPLIDQFIDYKQSQILSTPEETAEGLLSFLRSEQMGTKVITDVREIK